MFFRKNTSMNKLSAFTLAALLALGPAGCGGGGGGGGPTTGAPPATMPSRSQTPEIERTSIVVEPHPVFPVGEWLPREDVYLPTRPGVRQRVLLAKTANAGTKAVILFTGGNGTPITLARHGGTRLTANSLVRSSALFAEAGFITAVVELPLDTSSVNRSVSNAYRQSPMHHTDMRAVVDFLVSEGAREVFLIGTSRGTLSVAYLATVMAHPNVNGYVLTATLADRPPAVRSYATRITDPVLMAHHTDDACHVTAYADARAIFDSIPAGTRKDFITVSGGDPPRGRACGAQSAHGFLGVEHKTMAAIVDWMNGKTPPAHVSP